MLDFIFALIAVEGSAGDGDGDGAAAATPAPAVASAPLKAEPQVPTGKFTTALEIKPILTATKGNWVAVREWDGQDLIYVTHLWAWRCGLVQLEIAVNGDPMAIWPLPDCHEDTAMPNGITDQDGLPYRAFGLQSVDQIEVRVTYDDLTTDSALFDRASVLMP